MRHYRHIGRAIMLVILLAISLLLTSLPSALAQSVPCPTDPLSPPEECPSPTPPPAGGSYSGGSGGETSGGGPSGGSGSENSSSGNSGGGSGSEASGEGNLGGESSGSGSESDLGTSSEIVPDPSPTPIAHTFTGPCLIAGAQVPVQTSLMSENAESITINAWDAPRVVTGQYEDTVTGETWLRINDGWVDMRYLGERTSCGQETIKYVPEIQKNGYPVGFDIETCGEALADQYVEAPLEIHPSVITAYANSENGCAALIALFTAYEASADNTDEPPAVRTDRFADCEWDMPGYADLLGRVHRQNPAAATALNAAFENAISPCDFVKTLNHGDGLPTDYEGDEFLATILPLACNPSFSAERYGQAVEHLERLHLAQGDLTNLPPTITACHVVDYLAYVGSEPGEPYLQLENRLLQECSLTAVPTLQYMVTVVTLGIDPQAIIDGLPTTTTSADECTALVNNLLAGALARPPIGLPANLSEAGCSPSLIYSAGTHPIPPQFQAQLPFSCAQLASFVHTGYPNVEVEDSLPDSLEEARTEATTVTEEGIGPVVDKIIRVAEEAKLATATFVGRRRGTHQPGDIYILDAGVPVNLTEDDINQVFPALDPTGSHIVYIQDGETRQIMLWDLEKDKPTPLVTDPVGDPANHARIALAPLVFSPDGNRLLFTVEYTAGGITRYDIYAVMNIFKRDYRNREAPATVRLVEYGYAPTFSPYTCDGTEGGGIRNCTTEIVALDVIAYRRDVPIKKETYPEIYVRIYHQPFTDKTVNAACDRAAQNPCEDSKPELQCIQGIYCEVKLSELGYKECSEAIFSPDWQHLYLRCQNQYVIYRLSKDWFHPLDFGDLKLTTLSPGPAIGFVTYSVEKDDSFYFVQHEDIRGLEQDAIVTLKDGAHNDPILLSIPGWILSDIRWTTPNEEQSS